MRFITKFVQALLSGLLLCFLPMKVAALGDTVAGIHVIAAISSANGTAVADEAHAAVPGRAIPNQGLFVDARTVDELLTALGDQQDHIRLTAFQQLENQLPKSQDRITNRLAELLTSADTQIRCFAVTMLGNLDDPRAIDPAIGLLENTDDAQCKQAVKTLMHFDDPRVSAALISLARNGTDAQRNSIYNSAPFNPQMLKVAQALFTEDKAWLRIMAIKLLTRCNDQPAMEMLTAALHDGNAEVRTSARNQLEILASQNAASNDKLLPVVIELTRDPDSKTRDRAVRMLNTLHNPRSRDVLLALLQRDPDRQVREQAAFALYALASSLPRHDPQIVTALLEVVNEDDKWIREGAVWALAGYTFDPRVPSVLIAALNDQAMEVRRTAVIALGKSDDPHAVEAIIATLNNIDFKVAQECLSKIDNCKDPRMVDYLLTNIHNVPWRLQEQLAVTLCKAGNPRVILPLLAILSEQLATLNTENWDKPVFLRDQRLPLTMPWQQYRAISLLGVLAVEPLIQQLSDERRVVRFFSLSALTELKDARAFDSLLTALQSDDPVLRCYAARGLGYLEDVRALTPLLACLKDEVAGVRAEAAQGLGRLGDTRAVKPLLVMIHDPKADVQYAAIVALGMLKDAHFDVIDPLLTLAKESADIGVRIQAIKALGEIGDPHAAGILLPMTDKSPGRLSTNEYTLKLAATDALTKIGDPCGIVSLKSFLTDENINISYFNIPIGRYKNPFLVHLLLAMPDNWRMQHEYIEALKEIGTAAVPELLSALRSKDLLVRRRAATALAGILSQSRTVQASTRDALLAALRDDDAAVGGYVVKALLVIDEPRAVPEIAKLLADQSGLTYLKVVEAAQFAVDPRLLAPLLTIATQADGNGICRTEALHGIANIARAHPDAAELKSVVAPLITLTSARNGSLREGAVQALSVIHDPRVVPVLLPLLQDEKSVVCHAAAKGLAELGDQRAIASLLTWMKDLNAVNRWEAVKALEKFKSPQVIDALIVALHDPAFYVTIAPDQPGSVREQAALSLGALGDPRAVPALIEALDYGYLPGRRRAAEALGMLKDKRAVAPLIAALRHFAGDAASAPATALKAITGQDFGTDADRWQTWWDGVGKNG